MFLLGASLENMGGSRRPATVNDLADKDGASVSPLDGAVRFTSRLIIEGCELIARLHQSYLTRFGQPLGEPSEPWLLLGVGVFVCRGVRAA
jgi:hypothetical protein